MPQVKIRISQESQEQIEVEGLQPSTIGKEKIATISLFAHQGISMAKQIVNYEISNVGVKTGNYVLQEQINETMSVLSDIGTVGLGIASGGWVGGIIAVAGVTTKRVLEEKSRNEGIKHENIESEYLRRRSGNTTTSGSRGTEN